MALAGFIHLLLERTEAILSSLQSQQLAAVKAGTAETGRQAAQAAAVNTATQVLLEHQVKVTPEQLEALLRQKVAVEEVLVAQVLLQMVALELFQQSLAQELFMLLGVAAAPMAPEVLVAHLLLVMAELVVKELLLFIGVLLQLQIQEAVEVAQREPSTLFLLAMVALAALAS